MNKVLKEIHQAIEHKGWKVKATSAKNLPELKASIRKFYDEGILNPKFYREYKKYFEFQSNADFDSINSLIVVAVPDPIVSCIFRNENKNVTLQVPPTYLFGAKIIEEVQNTLYNILENYGLNVAYALLPVKTLSVKSGLAKYGRNNISYISGLGSFYRLIAFYSDLEVKSGSWDGPKVMDLCGNCVACERACPTNAISTDRFLIRAERCITYHNEQPASVSFPDWIDPSWHNCVIGCLKCQKVCPANKKVINWTEKGPSFNIRETNLLLSDNEIEDLPSSLKKKLEKYDLIQYYSLLSRNLGVFFK